MNEDFLKEILSAHTDFKSIEAVQRIGGGCINEAFQISSSTQSFFLKWNSSHEHDMFEAEVKGLHYLKTQSPLIVPEVLGNGLAGDKAYLLLEWIEKGPSTRYFWINFGKKLALQHKVTSSQFGLNHDNYIGRLQQSNTSHLNWCDFFVNERLEPQLQLAVSKQLIDGALVQQFQVLFSKLNRLVPAEEPSLLHGDLWSGNFLCNENERPVLIDPAVHFGHRETEIAFTELFGGFDPVFYQAYKEEFPLEPDFDERVPIHNLYPLLVHVNLFGASYLSGIKQTLNYLT